jgi:hypothetical protein
MADGSRNAEQCLVMAEHRLMALEKAIESQHGGTIDIGHHVAIVNAWRELGQARLELQRYKDWAEM